jgi:Protein of unknown function (DUF775)
MDIDFSGDNYAGATTNCNVQFNNNQQQQQQGGIPVLGFVVPGGPVRTDFQPIDDGTKWTLTLTCPGDLPSPLTIVSDVVCFLLPNAPIPPTHGLLLYWQVTSATHQTGFELLGSLIPDRPSGVLRTQWSEHEELVNMATSTENAAPMTVTLGVSMETREHIQNIANPQDQWQSRLFVAQKIATDLFRYMQSFDTSRQQGQLIVPTNIFDRWMARFESRFRRDPNFFMKSSE